jgi:hypothetical protein
LPAKPSSTYPTTPDGRYFVVRGRLWRCTNPKLSQAKRTKFVRELMLARSAKGRAMRAHDAAARALAKDRVNAAKLALGERGEPWWRDGAPDYNRHMAENTPYAAWYRELTQA